MENGKIPGIAPLDDHNRVLVDNVRPPEWQNPQPSGRYNLVIIGAGTAGLVAAAGGALLGGRVALVERSLLGGDCLNWGCVPSKAMIRCARAAHDARNAAEFGVRIRGDVEVDFPAVMERMRGLRSQISFHDSAKRFRDMGVDVFLGEARFTGEDSIRVGESLLRFGRALIATGARAVRPDIEGLADAGYLTNETVFSLTRLPARLAVIGGGPLGCELAQAFSRLGSEVTIFQRGDHLLGREDEEETRILQEKFPREGIRLLLNTSPLKVTRTGGGKLVTYDRNGRTESIQVDEILIGAGRAPNVEGLDLERAGIEYDPQKGVRVDDYLRTKNPRVFAAGDICLPFKFTHMADATARIALRNALFGGRAKLSALTIPWVTYTDPEIAHVGMSASEAAQKGIAVDTFLKPLAEVDRAVLDGETEGFVKIHVKRGTDRIVGATIVARHAGEMISEVSLAIARGVGLRALSGVIHPYPTQAEAIKGAGDIYNRGLLVPLVKRTLALWLRARRSEVLCAAGKYLDRAKKSLSSALNGLKKGGGKTGG
ncbi:MAG: mercuric reductase [Syntrophobacteraceae bacterium]